MYVEQAYQEALSFLIIRREGCIAKQLFQRNTSVKKEIISHYSFPG